MSEFDAYVKPGSKEEQNLIRLIASMVKEEGPLWESLLDNGTLLSSL